VRTRLPLPNATDSSAAYVVRGTILALGLVCLVGMFSTPSWGAVQSGWALPVGLAELGIFAAGLAIGCYGTLVGIGGGPLVVPILVFFYGWDPRYVVGTSLMVVFLNALSGTSGYAYQRRIDYVGGLQYALAALPGAVLSGFIHRHFNVPGFGQIFGVFLLILAAYCVLGAQHVQAVVREKTSAIKASHRVLSFRDRFGIKYRFGVDDRLGSGLNLGLGFLVGFLGIGGGVLQVPILVFVLRYPVHIATATSHFVTLLTCTYALAPALAFGHVRFTQSLWMGLGVVLGAQVGAWLSPKLDARRIMILFVFVILFFALRLLWN
jgi:uncharacterized protein